MVSPLDVRVCFAVVNAFGDRKEDHVLVGCKMQGLDERRNKRKQG